MTTLSRSNLPELQDIITKANELADSLCRATYGLSFSEYCKLQDEIEGITEDHEDEILGDEVETTEDEDTLPYSEQETPAQFADRIRDDLDEREKWQNK